MLSNMKPPQDYKTIARLCAELQRPYHQIKAAFDASGAVPEYLQNGVGYYSELAVEHMAECLPSLASRAAPRIQAKHRGRATPR
jgi:hypothetical protein